MKVISLTEPYATLIMDNKKKIETRSWKTDYRGELYIHAGKGVDKKRMDMISDYNLKYLLGYIIAKVNLTDCILVDEKMSDELRKSNPKVYTHDYTGYYAWKLDDVEILENPIEANGKLSIWNYDADK